MNSYSYRILRFGRILRIFSFIFFGAGTLSLTVAIFLGSDRESQMYTAIIGGSCVVVGFILSCLAHHYLGLGQIAKNTDRLASSGLTNGFENADDEDDSKDESDGDDEDDSEDESDGDDEDSAEDNTNRGEKLIAVKCPSCNRKLAYSQQTIDSGSATCPYCFTKMVFRER